MLRFTIRRLAWAVPTLLLVTFLVYVALRLGTDPLQSYLRTNPRASKEKIEQYKSVNGLSSNYVLGYFHWLKNFVTFNWPRSIKGSREVWPELKDAMANTIRLGTFATVVGVSIGLFVGMFAALKPGSRRDVAVNTGAFLGVSIPPYITAVLFQLVFAVYWSRWFGKTLFPTSGVYPPGHIGFDLVLMLKHMALPMMVVAIQVIATYSRYMRSSLLDVMNSDGCANDTTYFNYIDVYDYPVAGFTSRPNPASILNPSVQFVDTSSADVVYFDWTFYDSTNTMIGSDYVQNPIYNFSGLIEQQYYIQLYVENQNGCSDTVYGTQIVEGEYAFFLPNSFTPNGDGLNDSFFPVGDKISVENYSFKIFNRWGEMIFSTNDFNEKWDGTYQNNALSSDAYIWKIDLVDSQSGEEKSLKGYVLLSR